MEVVPGKREAVAGGNFKDNVKMGSGTVLPEWKLSTLGIFTQGKKSGEWTAFDEKGS